MACGTPILCSDTPSLLEVAGDATLVFPAQREDQLTAALHPLINDDATRADLRQRGRRHTSRVGRDAVQIQRKLPRLVTPTSTLPQP